MKTTTTQTATLQPGQVGGIITVPPSRGLTHRLLICAALAGGECDLYNIGDSDDIRATTAALQRMGALFLHDFEDTGRVRVTSISAAERGGHRGIGGPADLPVDCRDSASTLRFLLPIFGLRTVTTHLTGGQNLMRYPLEVYRKIFEGQGLLFRHTGRRVQVHGPLLAGEFTLPPGLSSQFVTGLLFALPLSGLPSRLHLTPPVDGRGYIELTRHVQALFGVHSHWEDRNTLCIPGQQYYESESAFAVEGDWSQAAVLLVMGALAGPVALSGLSPKSIQSDSLILTVLRRCGVPVAWRQGLLEVQPPPAPQGLMAPGEVDLIDCPDLTAILCTLALFCPGETVLLHTEAHRSEAMAQELRKAGAHITHREGRVHIVGGMPLHAPTKALFSHNDHRVVTALCAAGVAAGLPLCIQGSSAVKKSWPAFFGDLQALGVHAQLG